MLYEVFSIGQQRFINTAQIVEIVTDGCSDDEQYYKVEMSNGNKYLIREEELEELQRIMNA